MLRSTAQPCVSEHEAYTILQDAALRAAPQDEDGAIASPL